MPFASFANGSSGKARILGQWISEQQNLIVEVYQLGAEYKAKIIWALYKKDSKSSTYDVKNPNPALRSRNVIGMEVLEGLSYCEQDACWKDGNIYDATSGKTWSASARIDGQGTLVVRGYWGFELFGKTLRFKKYGH